MPYVTARIRSQTLEFPLRTRAFSFYDRPITSACTAHPGLTRTPATCPKLFNKLHHELSGLAACHARDSDQPLGHQFRVVWLVDQSRR
jgi:hypothetical protein